MRIRPLPFLNITLAMLASCSDAGGRDPEDPARPAATVAVDIVGGRSDKGRDPAVVAIDIEGEGLCSGTLVAPHVVMTARHCVSYTTDAPDCDSLAPQVFGERDASNLGILVGDDIWTAQTVAWGKELIVPPGDRLCDADIAFVVLDREVETVEPVEVELDDGVRVGQLVRAVGFGRRGDEKSSGRKYVRRNVPVLDATSYEFRVGEATCSGDSGGPALDQSSGAVLGVVSRGGPTCEGPYVHNLYTRADAFAELMMAALERAPEPPGRPCGPGKRCPNGYHCGADKLCEPVR